MNSSRQDKDLLYSEAIFEEDHSGFMALSNQPSTQQGSIDSQLEIINSDTPINSQASNNSFEARTPLPKKYTVEEPSPNTDKDSSTDTGYEICKDFQKMWKQIQENKDTQTSSKSILKSSKEGKFSINSYTI